MPESVKHWIEQPVEHCWVLLGGQSTDTLWSAYIRKHSSGTAASVAFDFDYVLQREAEKKDVIGFFHTHPGMSAQFSERDRQTMQAWCSALGKDLVCVIQGEDGTRAFWFGDFGEEHAYYDRKPQEVEVLRFDRLIVGKRAW